MTASAGVSSVERLLVAAAGAFADRGYASTTTRDIAARAGLSPAGVYVHFDSKEALLHALSLRGHEEALHLVTTAAAGPGPVPDRVGRVMAAFAVWHAEHYELARIVQYEFSHLSPEHYTEILRLRRRIQGEVRGLLEEGMAHGELHLPEVPGVRDTALALLSLCVDVARWYSPTSGRSPASIGRTYAALGRRLIGA